MKKLMKLAASLMVVTLLTAGCGKPAPQTVIKSAEASNAEVTAPANEAVDRESEEVTEEVKEKEPLELSVAAPSGAPTLSLIKMFKEQPVLGENVKVSYESVKSPDLINARVMSGEVDIAVVPTNAAAILYNKEVPYKLAVSNVWGVLYRVTSDAGVTAWEDLKGKEVHTIGRGLTPDIVLRYLLSENGINPDKDITINYYNDGAELAANFIAGKSHIAVIPEPVLSNVLLKKKDAKMILDLQEEWAKATSMTSSYPQASLIIKDELLENHPEVVAAFLEAFEDSINWANNNPEEAGAYNEELKTGLTIETVVQGIERSRIQFVEAAKAQEAIETYLGILLKYAPDQVGGKLPDEGFYYKK